MLRDIQLDNMEERYRERVSDVSDKMDAVYSRAEEKNAVGKDISAEKQEYDNLSNLRDSYYDQYREERNQVWEQYQEKIDQSQDINKAQDNDYSY